MKANRIMITAFVALTAFFTTIGCSSEKTAATEKESQTEERVEPVKTMKLEYRAISRKITYPANLEAFREVYLSSASPGRIEKIYVEAGSYVSEGQLLVEMDKTQLQQTLLQLQSVETDYRRLDTLRRAGSVSQQQYDQIKTQYDLLQSNAQFLRENTRLTAPFSGKVSGKYFENGEMFSGAPNTQVGKAAILYIVQTNQLKALVNVSEKYYPNIKTGMNADLSSDVYPGESFRGTVIRIYPTVDPATRSFTIEMNIPNRDERLRPGMFARASIELEQTDAFVVPALAVLKLQGSNERYVFIEENGKALRRVVELGERFDDLVEIVANGIKPGDNLIIAGQSRLLDGMNITVSQ